MKKKMAKACPFCGGIPKVGTYGIYIQCARKSCGAIGPERKTWKGAIAAWNKTSRRRPLAPVKFFEEGYEED